MNSDHGSAELTVDLAAIRHNYRLLQRLAGSAVCASVLKANAYGLGADRIAPVLAEEGCRHFFVAHVDEGIALRRYVPIDASIYVLHGITGVNAEVFFRYGLTPVLNSIGQMTAWRTVSMKSGRELPAVLQFDTGMSRMGLSPDEMLTLKDTPHLLDCFDIRLVMSHLACAEQQDHIMNARQLEKFNYYRTLFPHTPASLANSSGIFLGEEYRFNLVRPGAALYGLAPMEGQPNPLKQVVSLKAKVIQVRTVSAGNHVGYGARFRADGDRVISTLNIGYADGWPRAASGRTSAYKGNLPAPMVGTISMDSMTVDITGMGEAAIAEGDTMNLICAQQTVDAVAASAATIGYELLTRLGQRFRRVYIDDPVELCEQVGRDLPAMGRHLVTSEPAGSH